MSWEDLAVKLLEKRNLTRDRQPRFMGGNTPIVVMEILRYRIHSRQRGCSVPPASGAGRGALPGPETGLLSDTRRWVEETHADKARDFIGKGTRVEGRRVREPRTALPRGLKFYGDGMSFRVVLGQSFWFRTCPGGARIAQPSWMLARGLLGSGRTGGVPSRPFQNSSGWWWLVSSYSLSGSPVIKQLMQMVTTVPGQGGRFQSACLP